MNIGYKKEFDNFIKRKLKKIFNKNKSYNLEKSEIESDINIAGCYHDTVPHLFKIVSQMKNNYPLIMFMNKYQLEVFFQILNKEELSEIIIRKVNSNYKINYKEIIKENKILIFILDDFKQDYYFIEKIKLINKLNFNKHVKCVVIIDENCLSYTKTALNIENIKKDKFISYLYVSFELKFSLNTDISIIHKHYDPSESLKILSNNLRKIEKKHIISIRDIRDMEKDTFLIYNKNKKDFKYCYYELEDNNNNRINIEDYINTDMQFKLKDF